MSSAHGQRYGRSARDAGGFATSLELGLPARADSGSYRIDRALQRLLREGYVGDVLSVEVQMLQRGFADFDGELDWRHDREFSGYNVLNVGGTYESMMRWLGPGNRVMGMTRIHIPRRRDEQGALRDATIPDHVEVLYELANGAPVHMKFSETTGLSSGNRHLDLRQRRHDPHRRRAEDLRRTPRRLAAH